MATRNQIAGEDARTRKDQGSPAQRGTPARAQDAARTDDGTGLSLEDRRAMIRNEFLQEALPHPPALPGYHLCWLTTTSSYDPIHRRLRMGYELVRKEEMPGFRIENKMNSGGEYQNYITCNEMVLAKIPADIYQVIMEEFHHNIPLEEEAKIKAQIKEKMENEVDSEGAQLGTFEGDGLKELAAPKRAPVFQP